MSKSSLLKATEAPFLLLALIGFGAWAGTHIVDRALERPILEYSLRWVASPEFELIQCSEQTPRHFLRLRVRSLSNQKRIGLVEISLRPSTGTEQQFAGARAVAVAPAILGKSPGVCGPSFARFAGLDFQPRNEFELILGTATRDLPTVHLTNAQGAVDLMRADLSTVLVRHESGLLVAILVLAIALTSLYLLHLRQEGR